MKSIDNKVKSQIATRVPIPLTESEEEELAMLAQQQDRSKQSMAKIIYRLGRAAYVNKLGKV